MYEIKISRELICCWLPSWAVISMYLPVELLGILGIEKMSSHYEWSQLFNAHSESSPEVQLFRAIFQRPLDTWIA